MVWALTPVDTSRGTLKRYIFAAGTYKVGRKDCDFIVQTDASISRLHAEIAIEKMVAWDSHSGAPCSPSFVRLIDRSKYGTFINKVHGTQGSRLHKDEDMMLTDGDAVTFGTGNATFRLSFVPIVAFFHGAKSTRIDPSLHAVMKSIGAYATHKWSNECTHVLVDESCSLTPELLDAIMTRKQIVLGDWFKAMAEINIHTEIPSCTQYIPNLTLDGMVIKMVDISLIQNCLAGYTFILGSSDKYQFGDKLPGLLELTGAKYLHIDDFCANSQDSAAGDTDQEILVVPARYPLEFSKTRLLCTLSKIRDVKLVAAMLSGRLEATSVEPPASTSNPTDAANKSQHHVENISDDEKEITNITSEVAVSISATKGSFILPKYQEKVEDLKPVEVDVKVIEETAMFRSTARDEGAHILNKAPKDEKLETRKDGSCDVIFSQNLVVRSLPQSAPAAPIEIGGVNFKRFRKREIVSGNSFKDLVPFEREPYRESD